MLIPISTNGSKLGLSKASNLEVFTLVARQPPDQTIMKEDCHLGDCITAGKDSCHDEILACIVVRFTQRDLRSSKDDRFG